MIRFKSQSPSATHRVTAVISGGATRWSHTVDIVAPDSADHIDIINLAVAAIDREGTVREPPGDRTYRVERLS